MTLERLPFTSISTGDNLLILIQDKDALWRFPVDLIHSVVMRVPGLDPGIDPRIHRLCKINAKKLDPRSSARGNGGGRTSADSNRPGTAIADVRCQGHSW